MTFAAPASCPSALAFDEMVQRRLDAPIAAIDGATALQFSVEIKESSRGLEGWVRRTTIRGTTSEPRLISSAEGDCASLAAALALTVAVSVTEPEPAAANPEPAPLLTKAPAPPAVAAHARRAALAVGAGFQASGMLSPGWLGGLALFAEHGARSDKDGLSLGWPDLRLTVAVVRNDIGHSAPVASFTIWTAALDLCPARAVTFAGHAELRLCALGQVGRATGRGQTVDTPISASVLFSALGAVARARVAPGRHWFLEAQGGAVIPLRPLHFVFDRPHLDVASSPDVAWLSVFSVGLTL